MADIYPVPEQWAGQARVDTAGYPAMYAGSRGTPDAFWLNQARRLDWIAAPAQAGNWSFDAEGSHIRWFATSMLNASANCLDRHLAKRGDAIALIREPGEPSEEPRRFTCRGTMGHTSTLAHPAVVDDLIADRVG